MSQTNAELAQRLRGYAETIDGITKNSAQIDPRRAQLLDIYVGLLTEARALDPHPNVRLVVSNSHLPGALDYEQSPADLIKQGLKEALSIAGSDEPPGAA